MSPARIIESILFGGRWLLVPVYLGLVALLGILAAYFLGELWHALPGLPSMSENDVIILTLSLVDLSLTAHLVVLIILSGYENFVRRVHFTEGDTRPEWMGNIDFAGLKLKLLASITVIGAVHLLRSFLEVGAQTDRDLLWQVIIVITFGLLSLLLAVTDRVSPGHD
ncbi:TIGR00645 family protein [Acidocella sp.]|uniref:TIGR00645 family protein n=1 Tax=Acidocella sp. TaxID=50710 RepID=UPI00260D2708|nr:TIGR00645 family protein [Acidocella sp.]